MKWTPASTMTSASVPRPRERRAVADGVGDSVENVRRLIVVRQDDGVALLFEFQDRSDVIGKNRPFEWRDVPHDPPVKLGKWQGGRGDH
jgi:hypothetical protein